MNIPNQAAYIQLAAKAYDLCTERKTLPESGDILVSITEGPDDFGVALFDRAVFVDDMKKADFVNDPFFAEVLERLAAPAKQHAPAVEGVIFWVFIITHRGDAYSFRMVKHDLPVMPLGMPFGMPAVGRA